MAGSTLPPDLTAAEAEGAHEGHTNDGSLFPDAPTEPPFAFLGPETAPNEAEPETETKESGDGEGEGRGSVPGPIYADPDVDDPASIPHTPAPAPAPATETTEHVVLTLEPALPAVPSSSASDDGRTEALKAIPASVRRAIELDGGGSGLGTPVSGMGSGLFTPVGDGTGSPDEDEGIPRDGEVAREENVGERGEEELVGESVLSGPGPSALGTAPVIVASEIEEESEGLGEGPDVATEAVDAVNEYVAEGPTDDVDAREVDEDQERPLLSVDTELPSSSTQPISPSRAISSTTSDLELAYPSGTVSATSITFPSVNGTYAASSSTAAVADALDDEEEYGDEDAEGESDVEIEGGQEVMVFDLNGVPVTTPTMTPTIDNAER